MARFTPPELESARFQAGDVVAKAVDALKASVEEIGSPLTVTTNMPAADASTAGRVVLFVGETGDVYTQYHRYICAYDETEEEYIWVDIDTAGGG